MRAAWIITALSIACTPTPVLETDSGPGSDIVALDAAADVADATALRDVVRVEGGACVPACGAGQTCVDGVCEGDAAVPDAADATADVWRPARAYQSCEPIGSDCGDGLTCLAVTAGATQGVCTVPCVIGPDGTAPGTECPPSVCPDGGTCIRSQGCDRTPLGPRCVHRCQGPLSFCPATSTCNRDASIFPYCAP